MEPFATLLVEKIRQKMTNFFDSDEFFCRLFFLPTINFYRRIFLPTFFLTNENI